MTDAWTLIWIIAVVMLVVGVLAIIGDRHP